MCAEQWVTMIDRVRAGTGWPRVDRIDIEGNRWGRTCEARHGDASYRFFIVFTPEGTLRRFDPLEPLPLVPADGTEEEGAAAGDEVAADGTGPDGAADAVVEETDRTSETEGAETIGPTEAGETEVTEAPETAEGDATATTEEEAGAPGAQLHPDLRAQIDHEGTDFANLLEVPIEEARQTVRKIARETDDLAGEPPAVAMLKTSSFALPDHRVPVRVYLPTNGDEPFPAVLYFHGGGWALGDLDTHDSVCREIANRSYCAVVSVGYRRSPEHKFPEPLDDCYGALQWVADPATAARLQIDPDRIAVAGDSVGGNMAAVVCVLSRDRGGPKISAQVLICPVTAYEPDTPSYREFAEGFGLSVSFMPWMWTQYLRGPEDAADPHVVPLRARDLARLPTALVITAECDILRDEGEEYGERLRAAGTQAQVTRYPRMPHGFLDYRGLVDEGWDALDEIGAMLRKTFGRDDAPPPQ